MSDERDSVDFDQTEDLVKFEAEKNSTYLWVSIFIALSIFITGHALYSIYELWTDESIPLVVCPKSFDLDSPVVMNTINETEKNYVQDRWIRGFIRRYVLNSFPRTAADTETFFTFIKNHSQGKVSEKYESYLKEIDSIRTKIGSGSTIRFYAKSGQDIRIRPSEGKKDQWVVEVDGYLVKTISSKQERTVRTLRYVVQAFPATRTNPDGLNVIDSNMDLTTDYVSGQKEVIQEEGK